MNCGREIGIAVCCPVPQRVRRDSHASDVFACEFLNTLYDVADDRFEDDEQGATACGRVGTTDDEVIWERGDTERHVC